MNSRISWKSARPFTETSDYVNLGPTRSFPNVASAATKNHSQGASSHYATAVTTQNTPYSRPQPSKPKMDDTETASVVPPKKTFEPDLNRFTEEQQRERWSKQQQDSEPFRPAASTDKSSKAQRRKQTKPEPQDFKRILIGSVEHVVRWQKIAKDSKLSFLFEAVGILDNWSIKGCAQILFLRGDLGQVIQGLFYSVDHGLPPFKSGSIYSFVGKMVASHKMIVFDAKEIQPEEKAAVQRLAFLCQRQLSAAAGKEA